LTDKPKKRRPGRPTREQQRDNARAKLEADILSGKDINQTTAHGQAFCGPATSTLQTEVLSGIKAREKQQHDLEMAGIAAKTPVRGPPMPDDFDLSRIIAAQLSAEGCPPELRDTLEAFRNSTDPSYDDDDQFKAHRSGYSQYVPTHGQEVQPEPEPEAPALVLPEGVEPWKGVPDGQYAEMLLKPEPGKRYQLFGNFAYAYYWPPEGYTWRDCWTLYDSSNAMHLKSSRLEQIFATAENVSASKQMPHPDAWEQAHPVPTAALADQKPLTPDGDRGRVAQGSRIVHNARGVRHL